MERRDGTTYIDAVVQRDLDDTVSNEPILKDAAHALSGSHLHFASEYRPYGSTIQEPYRNWLLLPLERASGHMFPIPPGAVRGVWRKPAVTSADVGKRLTVVGETTIMVNGEARSVGWKGAAPGWAGPPKAKAKPLAKAKPQTGDSAGASASSGGNDPRSFTFVRLPADVTQPIESQIGFDLPGGDTLPNCDIIGTRGRGVDAVGGG